MAEGNREFKGTEWAKTWVLWHDPLSIMYSKEGMAYMSSIGFGPRRHILCTDYTLPQKYWNVKPGKRAETNPCDEHLNADVEEAIKVLVLLSSEEPFHLAEGHPDIIPDGVLTGKYSKNRNKHRWLCNTVGELRRTYIEAFTNSPTQHRIREDILRGHPSYSCDSSGHRQGKGSCAQAWCDEVSLRRPSGCDLCQADSGAECGTGPADRIQDDDV